MKLAAIWAQDQGGVLGDGTRMLWRVPADLAHFKENTMGSTLLMGRSSFQSLRGGLPGRQIVVLSRQVGYEPAGAVVANSLTSGVQLTRELARERGADTAWVTGGGQVYAQAIGLVDELVVTDLDFAFKPGGSRAQLVHAPKIDPEIWEVDASRSDSTWRERSGDGRWRVTTYVRR